MSDLRKHGWKFAVIFALFALAGTLDYEHEAGHESIAKVYYDELKQQYGRTYAAKEGDSYE